MGHDLAWGLALLSHAAWRTLRPRAVPAPGPESRASVLVVAELALCTVAVMSTGYWLSPFVFCLMTAVIAAAFARGYPFAVRNALVATGAIGIPFLVTTTSSASLQVTGQWSIELLLVAILAGYARRLFGEAEERHTLALDRMSQLTEANDLLVSLHRVAQSLPASLNLADVLSSTVTRLRGLIDCEVTAILLRDEVSCRWVVAVGEGTRPGQDFGDDELPAPLLAATSSSVSSLVVCLARGEGLGADILSRSGLYAPLRARGALVGLVALEHHDPGRYGRRELRLLDGFIESAALAIDNARWFRRLRAMGADEERVRIARDMHDRVGQSLACLAFRLDSITTRSAGNPMQEELQELRREVRGVLGEVRDTLSDLRTDVSDHRGLAETLETLLDRVRDRGRIEVRFTRAGHGRMPLVQERELWRIAMEAITNAERHAGAGRLDVHWASDGTSGRLVVSDDGRGFAAGAGRPDSYGITGMKERADAIGATLAIESDPAGTTVTCELGKLAA